MSRHLFLRSVLILALALPFLACSSGDDGPGPNGGQGGSGGQGGAGGSGGVDGGGGGGSGGSGGDGSTISWLDLDLFEVAVPLLGEVEVRVLVHRSIAGTGDVQVDFGTLPAGITIHNAAGGDLEELIFRAGEAQALIRFRAGEGVEALDTPFTITLRATTEDERKTEIDLLLEVSAIVTSTSEGQLRTMIEQALEIEDKPTIHFRQGMSPSTFTVSGPIPIERDLSIEGWTEPNGRPAVTLQAGSTDRVVEVLGADVHLRNLRIADGTTNDAGGCILNEGELHLENVEVSGCWAAEGGGIYSAGPLTIESSRFVRNGATTAGGAAFFRSPPTIVGSEFMENDASEGGALFFDHPSEQGTLRYSTVADNVGGGIQIEEGSELIIEGSTISGNETVAQGNGGGIASAGTLRVANSTIAHNTAVRDGGGLYLSGGEATLEFVTVARNDADRGGGAFWFSSTLRLRGSLIAENDADDGGDLHRAGTGTISSEGYNLVRDLSGTYVSIPSMHESDLLGTSGSPVEPLLGELADNGGPMGFRSTRTIGIGLDSPAIDAVPEASCAALGEALEHDQRGMSRPRGEGCDIGAFENHQVPDP